MYIKNKQPTIMPFVFLITYNNIGDIKKKRYKFLINHKGESIGA